MIFTQSAFLIFAVIVVPVYYVIRKNLILNQCFLLAASYVFYGWADWRFAVLLLLSSSLDFLIARRLHRAGSDVARRRWLILALTINLGILGFFKYYILLATTINGFANANALPIYTILLPAGISFYTFQSISYIIDVYRRKLEPTDRILTYLLFVSFFPQLVAGPIERATRLLPQFYAPRELSTPMVYDGMRQILAGLAMKVLVADNLGHAVDAVYGAPQQHNGSTLLLATLFFSFQIYCDFAGYSNIAIGLGKIMGFEIMRNFATPYFATSPNDFWRRWHISLSTFFRDYVYNSLGGSRAGLLMHVRNIFIVFALSGIWHGANWTFLAWGIYHATGLTIAVLLQRALAGGRGDRELSFPAETLGLVATQLFVLLGWVYFRAGSIGEAHLILGRILDIRDYNLEFVELIRQHMRALPMLLLFVLIEFLQRRKQHILEIDAFGYITQGLIGAAVVLFMLLAGAGVQAQFIYFRF